MFALIEFHVRRRDDKGFEIFRVNWQNSGEVFGSRITIESENRRANSIFRDAFSINARIKIVFLLDTLERKFC